MQNQNAFTERRSAKAGKLEALDSVQVFEEAAAVSVPGFNLGKVDMVCKRDDAYATVGHFKNDLKALRSQVAEKSRFRLAITKGLDCARSLSELGPNGNSGARSYPGYYQRYENSSGAGEFSS